MATKDEITQHLINIADRADKAKAEIIAAVQLLKDEIATAGASTPEMDAALARLDASVATLDDLNPDTPEVPAQP